MTRRRPRSHGPGQDRWLVSYADFITLLFAFFVTLYAVSSVDADKLGSASTSLQVAFNADPVAQTNPPNGPPQLVAKPVIVPSSRPVSQTLDAIRLHLTTIFDDAVKSGRLEVIRDSRGLVLSLPEGATFESASADITPTAEDLIVRVAEELARLPQAVRIEGHTDDLPIRSGRYRSNWELSTARASSVVALFLARTDMAAEQLSAAGYAEFHPLVANDSPEHRAKNRRVDIVVLDREARQEEPDHLGVGATPRGRPIDGEGVTQ